MGDWQPVLGVLEGEMQFVADTWQPPRQPTDPDIWFETLPACDWDGPKTLRYAVVCPAREPLASRGYSQSATDAGFFFGGGGV